MRIFTYLTLIQFYRKSLKLRLVIEIHKHKEKEDAKVLFISYKTFVLVKTCITLQWLTILSPEVCTPQYAPAT